MEPLKTMSKKKKTTKKAIRGCGGRARVAPVRFRVARVVTEDAPTHTRQNRDQLYEEIMMCLNSAETTRKRPGRPRKLPRHPIADATDVIYLSNATTQGPPKHFPLKTRGGRGGGRGRTSTIVNKNCLKVKRCPVYPSTTSATSCQYTQLPCTSVSQQELEDDWPEDLNGLLNSWDSLPESRTRETVKWLQTPLYPQDLLPEAVRLCHALVQELFLPSSEERLDELNKWLETEMVSKEKPQITNLERPVPTPPKVVVESQPSSLQNCCQWSSMAVNQDLREANLTT